VKNSQNLKNQGMNEKDEKFCLKAILNYFETMKIK
jgi:hypothetical protein